ncbi:MAG TPA: hypothetical protein VK324_02915 [Tepidisphaeraceae bacterium]|nr:hypothetical protein [Tepidisphaeraceae bacterium]
MADADREPDLHRNNAAEWVMFAALWPVAKVVWLGRMLRRLWDKQRG